MIDIEECYNKYHMNEMVM